MPHDIETIAEEFFREGCVLIPGILAPDEVTRLRDLTDAAEENPGIDRKHHSYAANAFVLRRCHEQHPYFEEMTRHQEIVSLVETVLKSPVRFNAINVIKNRTGQAISNWHVDDVVEFPLPPEIPRFDPRMRMPVFWLTVQVALSDIDSLENGPTQFAPGSHYSGRRPPTQENPTFEGRETISLLCKAGDIYLFNHQTWHRGAPNISERTRYVMQLQYAVQWADTRFKGVA